MSTAHAIQPNATTHLSEALKSGSCHIETKLDAHLVYAHLSASMIGEEPSDDLSDLKEVPASLLMAEVMRFIEQYIASLGQNAGHAKVQLGALSTMLDGPPLPVDMQIRLRLRFEQVKPNTRGLVYMYRYEVVELYGTDIYLRGLFELCCMSH